MAKENWVINLEEQPEDSKRIAIDLIKEVCYAQAESGQFLNHFIAIWVREQTKCLEALITNAGYAHGSHVYNGHRLQFIVRSFS